MELTRDGKEIVFIWAPSHVGFREHSAADSVAKDALTGNILGELIALSRTNKYMLEVWQLEWDEFPENKLHKIFPVLFVFGQTERRKLWCPDCALAIFVIFVITHPFLLKGEEPPVCIRCDERLTDEHILLTCSDFFKIRESHFTAQSLHILFQDISMENIFNFLKEVDLFGRI